VDTEIRILFLGAGKRVSLIERFKLSAKELGIDLIVFSAENSKKIPLAAVANILIAPHFLDDSFGSWLIDVVKKNAINLVIPNMDSATVALSNIARDIRKLGALPLVSSYQTCVSMKDKAKANEWFTAHGIQVPGNDSWPKIMKPKTGFGGKNQIIVKDANQKQSALSVIDQDQYFQQNFIQGKEYSVDAYVSQSGEFIAAMPRWRIKVTDGEVDESLSVRHPEIEELTAKLFSIKMAGWRGPLTAQFIDDGNQPWLIEVNPRFGGGVTHSMHCGLDFDKWIFYELLSQPLPVDPVWEVGSLMTRCRRDIFL
jgi:carbamoyl-phosphate synthase large subunit